MVFFARALVVLSAAFLVSADIRSDLTGKGFSVLFPGDSGYSTASQAFNQRFSYQPGAIAYPVNSQQVSTVIKAGSANNLRVVARSGGHSYIANGVGGQNNVVVVDMKNFNTLTVDSSTNTAVIGTGMRLGNVALALNAQGRALPHGTCPYVGVGGHSGYGGFGFTSRMWGLTLDNIISLNVVLADGTITTASATTNPDLFWALRGSSGSFGITTAIQVKTYAAPSSVTVFTYNWDLTASAAASALGSYQTFAQSNIPAQLGLEVVLGKGSSSGRVNFEITGGWYGAQNQFSGSIAPLLSSLPSPSWSTVTPGSYIDSVKAFSFADSLDTTTGPEQRDTFYAKSLMTPQASPMSTSAINSFMSYLATTGFSSSTSWFIQFELWGAPNSAINAVSSDATAFPHRSSMFAVQFYAYTSNSNPPFPSSGFTFVDGAVNAIVNNSPSGWDYGAYVNYVDDRLQDWQQRYYGSAYSRLNTLKTTYDPNNLFSFPTGIQSSGGSTGGGSGGGGNTSTSVAIHPNGNTSKCLDVRGAVYANGTPVQIYDCNGTPAQSWTITRGSTQVRVANTNFCLDAGSSPANGVGMKIWTCFSGLAAQTWSYTTSNSIALSTANQCLDLTDGSVTNGNQVQTWQCSAGNANQMWTT